jgi:Family of unknown function (DUF5670)
MQRSCLMLWTLTILLVLLWALGLISGYTLGSWIHLLLILAIVSLILAVMRDGGRTAVP